MIALDVLEIILLFSLFAFSHTLLASRKIKKEIASGIFHRSENSGKLLEKKTGSKIAFYRLFYNFSSLIIFIAFYSIAPRPDVIVYDLRFPFDIITFALQILSLTGIIWAARSFDLKEFLGIAQIKRYMRGEYNVDDLDENSKLKVDGAYKLVRHPLYLFFILFLGLRPTMNLFYLTTFVCIVVYFYVGSIYEEKKLVERFGDEYREYQKRVPRLFPLKIGNKKIIEVKK
ncbi:MAG: isoprenylcysteine carboxylmethyltransferase family protein [Bacteroidota bacterium]